MSVSYKNIFRSIVTTIISIILAGFATVLLYYLVKEKETDYMPYIPSGLLYIASGVFLFADDKTFVNLINNLTNKFSNNQPV